MRCYGLPWCYVHCSFFSTLWQSHATWCKRASAWPSLHLFSSRTVPSSRLSLDSWAGFTSLLIILEGQDSQWMMTIYNIKHVDHGYELVWTPTSTNTPPVPPNKELAFGTYEPWWLSYKPYTVGHHMCHWTNTDHISYTSWFTGFPTMGWFIISNETSNTYIYIYICIQLPSSLTNDKYYIYMMLKRLNG